MGLGNKLIVSANGFPGTNKTWRFVQDGYRDPLSAIAKVFGEKTIISGVEIDNTNPSYTVVSDGFIVYNNEIIPFVGGNMTTAGMVTIIENIEKVDYNTDADDDAVLDNLPAYRTIKAVFGSGGLETFPFTDLFRIQPYKELKPIGMIEMWSGAANAIPRGYLLCDGTKGTPDLRDKFVIGAGSTYNVGDTAGQNEAVLTQQNLPDCQFTGTTSNNGNHSHSATATANGSHTHYGHVIAASGDWKGGGSNSYPNATSVPGNLPYSGNHTHNISVGSNGSHTHTATVESGGNAEPIDNKPLCYALCFIKYVGL